MIEDNLGGRNQVGAVATIRSTPLTGVGKSETIATNRPGHLLIPADAGMMEWAR